VELAWDDPKVQFSQQHTDIFILSPNECAKLFREKLKNPT